MSKENKVVIIDWNRGLLYEGKDSRGLSETERVKYRRLMEDVDREFLKRKGLTDR